FPASPFKRRFPNIHTPSQQIQPRDAHYETVRQVLLGNPPEAFSSCGPVPAFPWSTLQFHAFLYARPRSDPLAPGGHIPETGAINQRLAPGIDRVEAEIGDGDVIAGQIGRTGELIVRGAVR